MLEYKRKLENDPETKKAHDEESSKPLPKPRAWQMQKAEGKDKAVITEFTQNPIQYGIESGYQGDYNKHDIRIDKLNKVFQPDHQQPVMTLDDHGELEYQGMCRKHREQEESSKLEKEWWDSMTKNEQDDIGTYKDRDWDDWKDDHEKGAGNRANKRC